MAQTLGHQRQKTDRTWDRGHVASGPQTPAQGRLNDPVGLRHIYTAMVSRMDDLEITTTMLNGLGTSPKTLYACRDGRQLNRSTLPGIDSAMHWEPRSALDVYEGGVPRPKAPRTPLQKLILYTRIKAGRSLERVAELSDGRISQSQVHRLETEPLPHRGLDETHIDALAEGLSIPAATIRAAADQSTPHRAPAHSAYSVEVQIIADRLEALPPAVRIRAARSADHVITAFLDLVPRWARTSTDMESTLARLWDAWNDSVTIDELAQAAEDAAKAAREPGQNGTKPRRELNDQ